MKRKLTFDITPVPASRPRVSAHGTYYLPTYTQFKADMERLLMGKRKNMFTLAIRTEITFWIPIRASHSQKGKEAMDGTYCISNMDLDNLEKALYDSMNDVVYEDDKQIVEHTTRKRWINAKRGKIEVEIEDVEE